MDIKQILDLDVPKAAYLRFLTAFLCLSFTFYLVFGKTEQYLLCFFPSLLLLDCRINVGVCMCICVCVFVRGKFVYVCVRVEERDNEWLFLCFSYPKLPIQSNKPLANCNQYKIGRQMKQDDSETPGGDLSWIETLCQTCFL